uniref:Uncharacterized protein n=1 Tax=Glossina brevipalpis TaxID=37001 RepID=A0A1A9WM06_9MUSC
MNGSDIILFYRRRRRIQMLRTQFGKICLNTVVPLTVFLVLMTDFEQWLNMKYNNYKKARLHTTINQIYGKPNETDRNYRDLKARVNLKSTKRNLNTSLLPGVACVLDECKKFYLMPCEEQMINVVIRSLKCQPAASKKSLNNSLRLRSYIELMTTKSHYFPKKKD